MDKMPLSILELLAKYPQLKAFGSYKMLLQIEGYQQIYTDLIEVIRQLDFKADGGRTFPILKPCPLCHNHDIWEDDDRGAYGYLIRCDCGIMLKGIDDKEEAIKTWNTRLND